MTEDNLKNRIEEVIDCKIRPILQADQGDIELMEITSDGFVKVRLTGACSSCPGAEQTLSELVATELTTACREVKGVIQVHQVSEELISQALKILRKQK